MTRAEQTSLQPASVRKSQNGLSLDKVRKSRITGMLEIYHLGSQTPQIHGKKYNAQGYRSCDPKN